MISGSSEFCSDGVTTVTDDVDIKFSSAYSGTVSHQTVPYHCQATVNPGQIIGSLEQGNSSNTMNIPASDVLSSIGVEKGNFLRSILSQPLPPDEPNGYPTEISAGCFTGIEPLQTAKTEDPAEFALRPRCQSVDGNLLSFQMLARTPSRDSLDSQCDCCDSFNYMTAHSQFTEKQIEATRSKLLSLTTDGEPQLALDRSTGRNSSSQPGTPPPTELLMPDRMYQHRKYSEGSQLKARLQAMRMGFRTSLDSGQQVPLNSYGSSLKPVDLSYRRRRKFEGIVRLPYGRRVSGQVTSNCSVDEGIDDDSCSESSSILKSILSGRERSNTVSVCGLRTNTDPVSDFDSRRFCRQPVTLAKKNLHPVSAKIGDCLSRIVTFTRSVTDFSGLPSTEQRTIMTAALPRLLLLYMAEMNVHFVVAPILQQNVMGDFVDDNKESDGSISSSSSVPASNHIRQATACAINECDSSEIPTLQFAECVKNFVSKCQLLAISQEEYYYMRVIALFHSVGASTTEIADRANAAARRDLQRLVEQTCEDPLRRYSSLLMTFHTLFSIHCGMLETLFCQPTLSSKSGAELFFK